MDPSPENAPCWHDQYRPREILDRETSVARIHPKIADATIVGSKVANHVHF